MQELSLSGSNVIDVAHGARIDDLDIATLVVVVEIHTRDSGIPLSIRIHSKSGACLTVVNFSRLGRFDTL